MLKEGKEDGDIISVLLEKYDIDRSSLEKYYYDFAGMLQYYQLVDNDE